ncbi:MAG: HD domain-containing phosphohydrolase [Planctomycetota bacterium]
MFEHEERSPSVQPIFDLINEIVSTLDRYDVERCLGHICSNILAVTGGGACFIFLRDPGEGIREVTEARGEARPPVSLPLGRSRALAREVLEKKGWQTWADSREGEAGEPEPAVGLPLRAFETLIGALVVVRHGPPFQEAEVEGLMPIANIVALAIPKGELDGFAKLAEICIRFLEEKDRYTHGHSLRVMRYALLIADEVGLDVFQRRELRLCSLLHDIGKVIIKDSILSKKEALTRQEVQAIRMHPSIGSNITSKISPGISDKILSHHEWYDGTGYPAGLKGDAIPVISRIIAIADALDAMTSRRPYRLPYALPAAVREIQRQAGTQFDPDIVKALVHRFEKGDLQIIRV